MAALEDVGGAATNISKPTPIPDLTVDPTLTSGANHLLTARNITLTTCGKLGGRRIITTRTPAAPLKLNRKGCMGGDVSNGVHARTTDC